MKNIIISGAPKTGKSIISTSISFMTDLPIVSNRPSSEMIYRFNLSNSLSEIGFKELFTLGFSNFTDRIELEQRYSDTGFVSDDSILNNLVSMRLYIINQSKNTKTIFKWISNKRYLNECSKMLRSFERMIKQYFKNQPFDIVHLNPCFDEPNRNREQEYIYTFNNELLLLYKELDIDYTIFSNMDLTEVLEQIVADKKIKPKISPSNALFKAFEEMHIGVLNSSDFPLR
jgi:hypothetical protein